MGMTKEHVTEDERELTKAFLSGMEPNSPLRVLISMLIHDLDEHDAIIGLHPTPVAMVLVIQRRKFDCSNHD